MAELDGDSLRFHNFSEYGCGYGLNGKTGGSFNYGIKRCNLDMKFKKDDIIQVLLLFKDNNYKNCCLGFKQNGGDIKIAFDKLDINESYHIATSLYLKNV